MRPLPRHPLNVPLVALCAVVSLAVSRPGHADAPRPPAPPAPPPVTTSAPAPPLPPAPLATAPAPAPAPALSEPPQPLAPSAPPEPLPLADRDRVALAELAAELPSHGRAPAQIPPLDAPDSAWLALANQLSLAFSPSRTPKRAREAVLASTRPLAPAIRALVPTHQRYRALQLALRGAASAPLRATPIPETPYRLRFGKRAPEVVILRERLARERYIAAPPDAPRRDLFDKRLLKALQRWQRDRGLPYTSVVDPLTRTRLNDDHPHPVAPIMLALERWRDLELRHDDERAVIVHVNAFRLTAERDGATELAMPVVVGKPTPEDATPALSAALEAVITNPRWAVPARIVDEKLRPESGDDPARLEARGYDVDVQEDGRWRVRMRPGPDNPLGRIKFTLVGTNGVYLHDTPARGAFGKQDRSLSHGCVRVADAAALAAWILPEIENLPDALTPEVRSQGFRPATPLTVHLAYQTLSATADGVVVTHPDIYQRDPDALARLDPRPVVAALLRRRASGQPPSSPTGPPVRPGD
jgi:murein L,D-transpeptidase YcbB/YkuD